MTVLDSFRAAARFPAGGVPGAGKRPEATAGREGRAAFWVFSVCAAMLIWPAVWNGYPIVFADTGTYLSQAMHRYLGWDRPGFYSVFIFAQHLRTTTWPVVLTQACLAIFVLDLTRRALGAPRAWLPAVCGFLSIATWFPWTVSELMPDLLTPLLVLLLSILLFAPSGFRVWERWAMTALTGFAIAAQSSSLPLAATLIAIFPAIGWRFRACSPLAPLSRPVLAPVMAPVLAPRWAPVRAPIWAPIWAPVLALGLAVGALMSVNLAAHGRASVSPFGNVYLLARAIYDGPGMAVLRRDCPGSGWRLCPWLDRFPPTSDDFLWNADSPIVLAGGHKAVSADANAILLAAAKAEPGRLARAFLDNAIEQLARFGSGDGLEPWGTQVAPLIEAEFPGWERAMFRAARQQNSALTVPAPLAVLHRAAAVAGIVAAGLLLPLAWRRRHPAAGFLIMALLTLPIGAAVTGGLSTPHDRYQSRIVWLPACVALLSMPALLRRRGAADAP